MKKYKFEDYLIMGGILNPTKENIDLRKLQINQGLKIHTCNDYENSIETIHRASKGQENLLRLITKVYYKYPNLKHRRFRPIYNQINEQVSRLGFLPSEYQLQICCYCSYRELTSLYAEEFFMKIKNNFGISKIFLETYPIYKYNYKEIALLNKRYKGIMSFGICGYQNLLNRVFSTKKLKELSDYSLDTCFIGILGKGVQNKIFTDSSKSENNLNAIDKNLLYFLLNVKKNKNIFGITNVSNLNQYKDLKSRFNLISKRIDDFDATKVIDNISTQKIYLYKNYDQYGSYFALKDYFKRPKLLFSIIKYKIQIFFYKIKGFKNFFI